MFTLILPTIILFLISLICVYINKNCKTGYVFFVLAIIAHSITSFLMYLVEGMWASRQTNSESFKYFLVVSFFLFICFSIFLSIIDKFKEYNKIENYKKIFINIKYTCNKMLHRLIEYSFMFLDKMYCNNNKEKLIFYWSAKLILSIVLSIIGCVIPYAWPTICISIWVLYAALLFLLSTNYLDNYNLYRIKAFASFLGNIATATLISTAIVMIYLYKKANFP